MIDSNPHTLDPNEVSQLIKDGIKLDNSGNHMYVMRFGWNNEWNKAADPEPFKIKSHLNKKLREDALGMPYVVPPYGVAKHLRKKDDSITPLTAEEQIKAVLDVQSNYAIGEIQGSLQYPTGNVWLIIDIWPEFQAGVERGYYPPLVSPTFNFIKNTPDGVEEAQFLNLQGVPTSGYSSEYTEIQPICKNGIKECMNEMVIHGSAGHLEQERKNGNLFSLPKKQGSEIMVEPAELQQIVEAVIPKVTEQIEEKVAKPLQEITTKVDMVIKAEEANAEILKEVATKTEGVDETKVMTDLTSDKPAEKTAIPMPDTPAADNISGAAGKQILKELQDAKNDLKKLKTQADTANAQLRLASATSIVDRVHRNDKLDQAAKDAKIKEYVEMKNPDGTLRDLEFLDNTLKAAIPETKTEEGIAGAYGVWTPEETTTSDVSNRPKNSEMFIQ